METLRLALAAVPASLADPSGNRDTLHRSGRKAREAGADLIAFPELSLTGYANGTGAFERAITEDEALCIIQEAVNETGLGILAGYAEKASSGELFASHTALLPDGSHTTYRKLHLAPPEKGLYSAGTSLPLFSFKGFSIGMMLCYDAHFPLAFHHLAQQGADLVILPHASPRGTSEEKYDSWMRHLPSRAFDNSFWVAAVNQCGTNEAHLSFPALALAFDPSGHLAGPPRLTEGLHLVDIDQKKLTDVRSHPMRYFLPNTRNEF